MDILLIVLIIIVAILIVIDITLHIKGNKKNSEENPLIQLVDNISSNQQKGFEQQNENFNKLMDKSFSQVTTQINDVREKLGTIQGLSTNVDYLAKIFSNIKTRGNTGELHLALLLEQIFSKEQYGEQVNVNPNSNQKVDFALKLPGEKKGETLYLPIDAKFPANLYTKLQDAYDNNDKQEIDAMRKAIATEINKEAKDIAEKYIKPPFTTEFAILYLPSEGLYAEALSLDLANELQKKHKVTIAGPTTLTALLDSLIISFRAVTAKNNTGEILELLKKIKKEFDTFSDHLKTALNGVNQAQTHLGEIIGTRTNAINRALSNIDSMGLEDYEPQSLSELIAEEEERYEREQEEKKNK